MSGQDHIWCCLVNTVTGVSLLRRTLSSEFLLSCSVPDRLMLSATMVDVLDAVQSMPQNSESPLLEDAEVSQPFLGRATDLPQTRPVCF